MATFKYLMIPGRVDALHVYGETISVVGQTADFSSLPFFDRLKAAGINTQTPNISESIVNQPFQAENLRLGPGVHLHWALPDGLTQGSDSLDFPDVPDRWLITRRKAKKSFLLFSLDDFNDFDRFILKLKNPPEDDPVAKFLAEKLNDSTRKLLESYAVASDSSEATRNSLLSGLNEVLRAASIYSDDLFQKSSLNAEAKELLAKPSLNSKDIAHLNRLLLESVYTEEIASYPKPQQQWIVESNYLYSPGVNKRENCISIPYDSGRWVLNEKGQYQFEAEEAGAGDQNVPRSEQPFRFMGRRMPLSRWEHQFKNADYLDAEYHPKLTAIGYGEPSFAALYANCFSVFGFYDGDAPKNLEDISYDVVGWYGDPVNKDALYKSYKRSSYAEIIKDQFNWKVDEDSLSGPLRTLYYASVSFSKNELTENKNKKPDASITIAETGTEALSACLAEKLVRQSGNGDDEQLRMIEDQLEALQLAGRLDDEKLDALASFKEARHENGFTSVDSGSLWVLAKGETKKMAKPRTDEEAFDHLSEMPELSVDVAAELTRVNELQREYDRSRNKINSLRKQLFADWYKYMICAYPPSNAAQNYPNIDLVKYFIEKKQLGKLNAKLAQTGELEIVPGAGVAIKSIECSKESLPQSLAAQLADKLRNLISRIDREVKVINAKNPKNPVSFYLKQTPGPRYKRPNDPVILIEGNAVKPTDRHGADGELKCDLLELPVSFDERKSNRANVRRNFDQILAEVYEKQIQSEQAGGHFAFNHQSEQSWNPFLLEWEVNISPVRYREDENLPSDYYSENSITDNYVAPAQNPDLELRPNRGALKRSTLVYNGQSILTSSADYLLKYIIEKRLVEDTRLFSDASEIDSDKIPGAKDLSNPNYTLAVAYEQLKPTDRKGAPNLSSLSQTLTGFNEALLMHKQTMELEIQDPLNFPRYRQFSDSEVNRSMGNDIRIASSPANTFNPIRTGCLKLSRVRLVDTFGRTLSLSTDKVDTSYKLTEPDNKHLIRFTPRLVQPARLNFRWLRADSDKAEMQSHKATSPICGWLLTNKLDRSLVVYDHNGKALGYFKADKWRQAIDSDKAKAIEEIENPHLKRVVQFIQKAIEDDPDTDDENQKGFLENYIATIDDALDTIQPEASGFSAATLLVGRPLAVVRASFNLELQGYPAINQSWNAFRQDIASLRRTTNNFTNVKFPIRLGDYNRSSDGLIGYWVEQMNEDGEIRFARDRVDKKYVKFYSTQSDHIDTRAIESRYESYTDGPINLYQSISDPPQRVTMLMDVRGAAHATIGILPCKKIRIPPDLYESALQSIEVSFLHAPLLTQKGKVQLALRSLKGREWSWVECAKVDVDGEKTWDEWFPEKRIEQSVFIAEWEKRTQQTNGEQLWEFLFRSDVHWLATVDDDEDGAADIGRAKVIGKDDRKKTSFKDVADFSGAEAIVQELFDLYSVGIDPVSTEVTFGVSSEIREGWLKLRKIPK